MEIRANTEKGFFLKYLVIGLLCLAFAVWALYDGLVKFPGQIPRAEAWEKLQKEVSQEEWGDKWVEISEREGWSPKRPKKDELVPAIETKIVWQWVFVGLGSVIGIPLITWYLRNKDTWIELKDGMIQSSSGEKFVPTQVTRFDKKKWEKKGIGVVHYHNGESEEQFVIDDLKYERANTDAIVRFLESQIDPTLIVNGSPEQVKPESGASVAVGDSEEE